jgi:hypothetical protein
VLRVPAAEHDVIHEEGGDEEVDDVEHVLSPAALAELRPSRRPDVVLVRLAVSIRKVRELEWNHGSVADHRAPEAGAESEEEHLPSVVAAECLHRRVVDHAHGAAERSREVEADPTPAEVPWLALRAILSHGAGKSERDTLEAPIGRRVEHLAHSGARREARPRVDVNRRALAGGEQLHVRAADVDDQCRDGDVRLQC